MGGRTITNRGLTKPNNDWLGRQFWNQTFEDDVEAKIDEIRQLLDVSEDCDEAEVLRFLDHYDDVYSAEGGDIIDTPGRDHSEGD